MSRHRTAPAMLLVLGLLLVGAGIILMTSNEPGASDAEAVYAYADVGLIMVLAGITSLVIGLAQSRKEAPAEHSEVHPPQIIEQEPPIGH